MRLPFGLAVLALLLVPCVSLAGEEVPTAALEARLSGLQEMDAAEAYRLALELAAGGLEKGAVTAYERVIAVEPEHRAARRALGYDKVGDRWLRGDPLWRARGFIHFGGRWMTSLEFAEATRPAREAAVQKAGESRVLTLLAAMASEDDERVADARRRLAVEEPRFKLAPLARALRCNPVSLRVYAAEELGRMGDPLAVPALLKRAVHDPEEKVRHAVVAALREIDEPSTVHPLGRALESRYAEVRAHAAEALGRLGDALAAPYVIRKWEARSGDFPRVYISTVRQISYIQDFDVEVAQTSFIADPVVGVLQEGAVLAMKILATEQTFYTIEQVAYEGALKNLSGEDLGTNVRAWRQWWNKNESRLLEQRE